MDQQQVTRIKEKMEINFQGIFFVENEFSYFKKV